MAGIEVSPGSAEGRHREPDSDPGTDVRAQILARVAERQNVGSSLGEPVARRKARRRPQGPERPQESAPRAPQTTSARHRRPARGAALRQLVVFGVVTALLVIFLRTFVVASFYIPSGSMEPTLHGCPGCQPDLVMVDKLSYRIGHVSRGDVVVFSRPVGVSADDKELIKRVIGLPGESISGHDGKVWIGDRALVEPYVNKACPTATTDFAPLKIPAAQYFMMGDNRCDSLDSRFFPNHTIPGSTIVGRAFAVVWPLKHLRWL